MRTTVGLAAFCAALALAGCGDAPALEPGDVSVAEPGAVAPVAPAEEAAKWVYTEDTDQMRGTSEKFATLLSEDVVRTNWPYDQQPMNLIVRERSTDGLQVMIGISGQFVCNSFRGTRLTVKFDDGPLETFNCVEADSGPNDVVFITPPRSFVNKVKAAKTMMLEAPVYEIGNVQVTFDVEGLVWE